MIALALLACHLVGDFVFQTRWQAAGKLDHWRLRARHVAAYALAFVPLAFAVARWDRALAILAALACLHFLTDSRRFYSTLGDVVSWWLGDRMVERDLPRMLDLPGGRQVGALVHEWSGPYRFPPPNPWQPIPLMIDQTLHVVQIAALGWLLA